MIFKRICQALLLCILGACGSASDGDATGTAFWASLGPDGGSIPKLITDPTNASLIYAGTASNGLYQSHDGGEHWNAIPMDLQNASVAALQIHAARTKVVYVVAHTNGKECLQEKDNLFLKSLDDGKSWDRLRVLINNQVWCVADVFPDPAESLVLYARISEFYAYPYGRLARSADGGKTWNLLASPGADPAHELVRSLVVDPHSSNTLYAAAWGGLWKSTDAGASWQTIGGEFQQESDFYAIFADPGQDGVLYAGLNGYDSRLGVGLYGAFRSDDDGSHFRHSQNFSKFLQTIFPETGEAHLYGADFPSLSRRLYMSRDGGTHWEIQAIPFLDSFLSVTENPQNPATLYVGSNYHGVLKSEDGGKNWRKSRLGLHASDTEQIAVSPANPELILSLSSLELNRSLDGGATWTSLFEEFDLQEGLYFQQIEVDPKDASVFYCVLGSSLYKSQNSGLAWTRLNTLGLTRQIAIHPQDSRILYATNAGGRVSQSLDGGLHWSLTNIPVSNNPINLFIAPSNPQTLYYLRREWTNDDENKADQLFQSTDGGATWALRQSALVLGDLVVDAADPNTLYGAQSGLMMKSVDGGNTWTEIGKASLDTLIQDLENPQIFYGADRFGVRQSKDGGKTWSDVSQTGMTNTWISSLALNQKSGILYAATKGGGIFRAEP